jgi:hypothetical protein
MASNYRPAKTVLNAPRPRTNVGSAAGACGLSPQSRQLTVASSIAAIPPSLQLMVCLGALPSHKLGTDPCQASAIQSP